jgi:Tfp pilus assembly protein FimT
MQATRTETDRARPAPARRPDRRITGDDGFSLLEIFLICAFIGTVSAIGVIVSQRAIGYSKAESSAAQVLSILQEARERSVADRRDVEVLFSGTNTITVRRIDWVATPPYPRTTLRTYIFENGVTYQLYAGVPDTPFGFGKAEAVTFPKVSGTPTLTFTPEGATTDATGEPIDGTIFLGILDKADSARAITVMGATASLQRWSWNGKTWKR